GGFQIKSHQRLSRDEWTLHASGRILETTGRIPAACIDLPAAPVEEIGHKIHYQRASKLGLDYGPAFQGIHKVVIGDDSLEASLAYSKLLNPDNYLLHPGV